LTKPKADLLPDEETDKVLKLERLGGKDAPPLVLGRKFKDRPLEDQVAYLLKLASSLNQSVDLVEADRRRLSALCEQQDAQLRQATQQKDAQNSMIQQLITDSNAAKQRRLDEIQELRGEVERLTKAARGT